MFFRFCVFLLLASTLAAAGNVTFFLSQIQDECSMDGVSLSAPENTAHGSLCAYDSVSKKIWACPAPDSMCWGMAESCTGGNSTTPASNQLGCPVGSPTSWCCDLVAENCTETSGQINICWAKGVVNPNAGVPPAAASSIAASSLAAISSAAIASRISALATANLATTTLVITTSTPASVSTTTTPNSVSTSAIATQSSTSGSRPLSGGAIAGVTIAAVAGLAVILVVAFFIWRRAKNKHKAGREANGLYPQPYGGGSIYGYKDQGTGYYDAPTPHREVPVEIGTVEVVHEMSAHERGK
ncbi:hypothetical protein K432DRAFT_429842 [Lepidopterella palustris CBS 459.81]|uniref:Mid2 domain-containing protein n=1 Tax=Lepidopterella palustris CBS 459.81 TaxID=1314670 RepID=A0A8E2J9U7_9PEZI|nr:hypothetical protein K432DRAFT_429842 [Lepidopterella palustris CBS 459.81]